MSNRDTKVIGLKSTSLFLLSFVLLMVEVVGIVGLMILAKPLKQILPVYFILSIVLAFVSWFLLRIGRKSDNIKKQILLANLAGMIWWTLTEIGRDVFDGANIENQGGIFLLMFLFAALCSISNEISLSNKTALVTFIANWLGHIVLEIIMYFRNPLDPLVVRNPHAFWNLFGFGYGIVSAMIAIVVFLYVFMKKPKINAVMIFALVEYVMVLNLLYIFVEGLFAI